MTYLVAYQIVGGEEYGVDPTQILLWSGGYFPDEWELFNQCFPDAGNIDLYMKTMYARIIAVSELSDGVAEKVGKIHDRFLNNM